MNKNSSSSKYLKVEISQKSIILFFSIIIGLILLFLLRNIFILFFISFIVMSGLSPLVDKLNFSKVPRTLIVIFLFTLMFFIVGGALIIGIIPFVNEFASLAERIQQIINQYGLSQFVNGELIEREWRNYSREAAEIIFSIAQNIIQFIVIIVVSIYLLIEKERMEKFFRNTFGKRATETLSQVEQKLGAWLRGQIALSFIVGLMYYVALVLLGIDYALPLAILGGLFEAVPMVGPILALIPAAIIASTESTFVLGLVIVAYVVIQQIESHIIIPLLMKRAVGLNPLVVILAIVVGERLLGFVGVLLAVPTAAVIQILISEFTNNSSFSTKSGK